MKQPNYKKIYTDMIKMNFPDKLEVCAYILDKTKITSMDIITIQEKLFGIQNNFTEQSSKRFRSYDKSTILTILDYQKEHRINNSELARHFKLSRNTVSKWKKLFV
ncbi:helix-turn-helix domain-containing protein [Chryseobacterium sp.]|nr:helix-turn-helix domain-containing protein [Chryseobacterium sp.]